MLSESIANPRSISVAEFLKTAPEELGLELIAGGEGLETNELRSERIQKLGLGLAGYSSYIHYGRLQMIGKSETAFLQGFSSEERADAVSSLPAENIACLLITKGLEPIEEVAAFAERHKIPLLRSGAVSSRAIALITSFLQDRLAPETTIHGVLVEMHGLGVLIRGESGIGKSECALDLVARGHRLISDDSVRIKSLGGTLVGSSNEITAGFLEIRGLGIINVRELFGVASVRSSKELSVCIEFRRSEEQMEGDRLGLEMETEEICGSRLPKYSLPVRPGRNLASLVETAVKVYMLRCEGSDAAKEVLERHSRALASEGKVTS
ncbi:MAG: HPr(Ser) kinase/phosphatase [Acidobacteria bacterium]|nr:HPr(Ser) kinase/phosphatase [Acidobacteriota bacterium]